MEIITDKIQIIGFDADDTLWVNETYFREAEVLLGQWLSQYETPNKIDQELFKMEMENLSVYGYGVKGFILSMIELALTISHNQVSHSLLQKIIDLGKDMINRDIELLDNVEETLEELSKKYKLIVVTKGDLLDQERKLEKSGLLQYFHHIEVLSEKNETQYSKLLKRLEINPKNFLMIGNSLKSDVLPLLNIGAHAIHIPFHTTWQHEQVQSKTKGIQKFILLKTIKDLVSLLAK